jgi:hypothetical protein
MKFKIQNILTVIILLIFSSTLIFAGPRSKRGLSAAPELLIPVGSIGTSLSGSNLANISGVEALYWNPSGMATLNGKTGEVLFSYQKYIADINISYFAGAYKFGQIGNIGLTVKAMSFGDIQVTSADAPDGTGETYSPNYLTIGLSYAKAMTDRIMFGTTAKLITEKIARESSTGFALDFGLQYIVGATGLKFGVTLKNLGPSMSFDGPDLEQFYQPAGSTSGSKSEPRRITLADFELPTSLGLGLSYDLSLGKKTNSMVTFSGTFQNNSFSPDDYSIGAEYNFKKMFYLRGAYNFDQDYFETKEARGDRLFGPSFGAGIKHNFGNIYIAFDYAYRYVSQKAFSANHFFTLNLGF